MSGGLGHQGEPEEGETTIPRMHAGKPPSQSDIIPTYIAGVQWVPIYMQGRQHLFFNVNE